MQCCTCSNWIHLKCSLLSFSRVRSLGSSHSWSFPPCGVPSFFEDPTPTSTVTFSSDSSSWYTSTAQSGPLLLMQHSHPILAFKLLILFPSTLYLLPLHPHHRLMLLDVSLYLLLLLPLSDSRRVLQWNAEGLRARSTKLLHFVSSHRVDLICIQKSNLFYLPLSESLDSLLCDPIAPTANLYFSTNDTHASSGVIIFVRQDLSFSELSSLGFYSNTTPPRSHFLMFMLPLFGLLRRIAESIFFLPPFFPPRQIFLFWGTSIVITPSRTQKVLPTSVGKKHSIGLSPLTSSPFNDSDISTLFHRSSGSRFSRDISFALFSLFLSCSWEVLQNLGSDHLPILLTVLLSPVFRPNECLPSLNFQKARWDDFNFYFDCHCPSAEEYSSLSLSFAAVLFTSLTLNALLTIWCSGQTALLLPFWQRRLWRTFQLLSLWQ